MDMKTEEYPKLNVNWPIMVLAGDKIITGETRNITVKGMLINCDKPLKVDSNYQISIKPPDHRGVEIEHRVIWSNSEKIPHGLGMCFAKVASKDSKLLKNLVSLYFRRSTE